MEEAKLLEKIRARVRDGRLTCADAHDLAEETGETLQRIGEACDAAVPRIKIAACQLGCF